MTRKLPALLFATGVLVPLIAQAQRPPLPAPTEALAGFDTPTLATNPGSQSSSNGIAEPVAGDTFQLDQQVYETIHDPSTGLGPVFNGRSCVECHQNPVSGGASQFTELRAGHLVKGVFTNPTVIINGGANMITGRSLVNDRAITPAAQEHVPTTENLLELRAPISALGDGYVEAIDDQTLKDIAKLQILLTHGQIHGDAIESPMFEAPDPAHPGQFLTRVGRFGWKDQHGSLLSFTADAYVNEMGVTSRLRMNDFTNVGKSSTDTNPEDHFDALQMEDIDHFVAFLRGTKAPPRDPDLQTNPQYASDASAGEKLFLETGCGICHVPKIVTAPAGTPINAGQFTVQAAVGNKIIRPFGDYLLHDIGTAGGIVQDPNNPQEADKLRTAPLWGLRTRPRYMHDLASLTLEEAIERHRGEAEHVTREFNELSDTQKQQVFTFLNSL